MADREHMVVDLLCGELQTSWSYCDPSCISCKFYHEESDMGARVSICIPGFGRSKESCDCYMTQHEYSEFVRSSFANLKAENAKLREEIEAAKHDLQVFSMRSVQLDAENAKLRNQLHDQQDTAQHNFVRNAREYKRVCDENDRLRELVRDMWRFTGAACKLHPRLFDPSAQGGQMVQLNAIDAFEQRMRELGAEVDG